jgi:hypothetical protein
MAAKRDPRLDKYGLKGYNVPKRTPDHPTKKGVVLAKEGDKVKLVRFGDQKMTTAGKAGKSDSASDKARRASFNARHAKNIARGRLSGAFWSKKELW